MTADEGIDELEVRLLLEAIHGRYGYDLRGYAAASLRRRIAAALTKSGDAHLGALQHRLLHDREVFAALLDDLTVQVTDMFRDPSFYAAFRSGVVPVLRTYPLLKIWHSGCATGEEVYAMAIVLQEEGLYERCQIYATDLNSQALEQAKQGVYAVDKLEAFSDNYAHAGGHAEFRSHCRMAQGRVAMDAALRKNILFFQHNLVSDHVFGEMHVVFCRNVLIYFGRQLRARAIDTFAQSLCPGGFLCLGASERPPSDETSAFGEFDAEMRIFRREPIP